MNTFIEKNMTKTQIAKALEYNGTSSIEEIKDRIENIIYLTKEGMFDEYMSRNRDKIGANEIKKIDGARHIKRDIHSYDPRTYKKLMNPKEFIKSLKTDKRVLAKQVRDNNGTREITFNMEGGGVIRTFGEGVLHYDYLYVDDYLPESDNTHMEKAYEIYETMKGGLGGFDILPYLNMCEYHKKLISNKKHIVNYYNMKGHVYSYTIDELFDVINAIFNINTKKGEISWHMKNDIRTNSKNKDYILRQLVILDGMYQNKK